MMFTFSGLGKSIKLFDNRFAGKKICEAELVNSREAVNVDLPENKLFGRDAVNFLVTDCNVGWKSAVDRRSMFNATRSP